MDHSKIKAFLADEDVQSVFAQERDRLTRKVMHAKTHESGLDAWLKFNALKSIEQRLQRIADGHEDD